MVTTERRARRARWTCTLLILFTVALAALLAPTDLVASASANAAAPTFGTPCFTSANIQQGGSYTVPATGVSTVRAVLRGQNGQGGGGANTAGGLGATLIVEVAVTPGQVLHVGRLTGAPGGTGAGTVKIGSGTYTGRSGGNGGDAQYLSTAGSDGCQHALAVAAGGGGGSGRGAVGGNADAGTGATGGANGGNNNQEDGGGGGGATATGGGTPGHKGYNALGDCNDGNHGRWGEFLTLGNGGNAPGMKSTYLCDYPAHGGGGGGGGYYYGGGGGSPYSYGNVYSSEGVTNSAGGGGGGSTYLHASATKLSLSAGASAGDPLVVPVYDTAITITSSPNPTTYGTAVTITARVTVVGSGRPVPGGTVGIYLSAMLIRVPVGANGEATLTTTELGIGLSYLQARFFDTTNPTEAFRDSWTQGSITQVVHPCAPAPSFIDQPVNVAATIGTSVVFSATVSVAPVYGGTSTVRWQTSTDGGTTWADAPGDVSIETSSAAPGTGRVSTSFNASVPPGDLKYRAVATTCGGTATSNAATLTVKGIAFDLRTLPAKTYGDAAFDIGSYASASTVAVSFSSATPAVCTVAGDMVTLLAAGTCTINADQDGTSSYPAAPRVQQSFTVGKKTLTVVAGTPPSQPQGTASAPTVTCTASGLVGSDGFVTPPTGAVYGIIHLNDGTTMLRGITVGASTLAGKYVTRCTGGDPGGNYTIGGYTNGTFTIGPPLPPPLTISANSKSYTYGTAPPTLDVAYNGGSSALVGTLSCRAYAKSDTGYASPIALSGTTPVVAGGYAIRCSGLASASYTITWADGTLTVNPAPVAVTASSPTTQTHGATAAPSVTCSATGFVGADRFVTNPTGAVYDASGTDQVSIGSTASAGEYVTKCTGGDPGSNYTIGGYIPGTFTVQDTTAPVVSVPASMILEATGPAGATATFSAAASDAVDGPTSAICAPASGSTFGIGTTTVTCSASDTRGNSASTSFTVTVRDTTQPDTSLTGTPPANPTKQTGASFTFSGTDIVGVARFECKLDAGAFAACTSPTSYSGLAEGSHTFQVRARDAAGNADQTPASHTWTIDTTPPVITVGNVTVNATSPAGATVPFTPTATDANPASPVVTCTPTSGGTFGIGTTTVNCSATDAAGNTGTVGFTVTVKSVGTQLTDLQAKVQSLPLDPTARKNLQSILQNAQAAAGKGDIPAACDKLTSFVSQVQAQSGKKIAAPTADGLLLDARRIMAVLGCS